MLILMRFELRALETEKDCQRELDKLGEKLGYANEHIKEHQEALDKYRKEYQKLIDEVQDIVDIAKKKGFKYKIKWRNKETDFEKRKKEILKRLEVRALETEKDYQREINDWAEQVEDRLEKVKSAEEEAKYWKDEARADAKHMEKIYKEGISKGFKLKMKTFKF